MRYWLLVRCLSFARWLSAGEFQRGLLADAEGDSGYATARRADPWRTNAVATVAVEPDTNDYW